MKIKVLAKIFMIGVFIALLSVFSNAQEGATTFKEGYTVAVKTEKRPSDNNRSNDYIRTIGTSSGYTINRLIIDETNKIYYGYDYKVVREGTTNKFKISFAPLSVDPKGFFDMEGFTAKPLPKYPAEIVIEDGDSVTLDILENPQTGAKVSDVIKITTEQRKFSGYFTERQTAKDFSIEDIELHFDGGDITAGDKKYNMGGSVSANYIWIYLPEKGRFIFSIFPQPAYNFQKIGFIEYNKILFNLNGENYRFISKTPILASASGKWNLWVKHEPNYIPSDLFGNKKTDGEKTSLQFGGATTVDLLFTEN